MSIQAAFNDVIEVVRTTSPAAGKIAIRFGPYHVRLAENEADRVAIYRLRFEVFNLELNEGLESAFASGCDQDEFDEVCDHLLVEHAGTGCVVGTYRLQTGAMADQNHGFYSAREFDFAPYEALGSTLIELGRACIHRDHRTFEVLTLLWRGIAEYALAGGARYLIGCSSLTSQDPATGWSMFRQLQNFLVEPKLRTLPLPTYVLPDSELESEPLKPPRLLRAYLAIGAQICGPPAIDREFRTIDFLTLLDLSRLSDSARVRFLGR
ncbi:MAG: GNAT family N-acetyltransferase [Acidobacteriales bacterium]|nr:GNAT family N-acetyltransferase [Terriglobales bacterium]